MNVTLAEIAQVALDLYYRDYKPDDQFIGLEHTRILVVAAYNKLINDRIREEKLLNKAAFGYTWVDMPQDWLESEVLSVKKDPATQELYVKPSRKLFVIDFDSMSSSIQMVEPVGGCPCSELIRIGINDKWMVCKTPYTGKSYYYATYDRVVFLRCAPEKVRVTYVPDLDASDETATLSQSVMEDVIRSTVQMLAGSMTGMPADKVNNSNSNVSPQTETDTESLKP